MNLTRLVSSTTSMTALLAVLLCATGVQAASVADASEQEAQAEQGFIPTARSYARSFSEMGAGSY